MSIAERAKVADLERRVQALESKLSDTAESLAYLHGHVLGLKENPDLELPAKLKTLTLPEKRKSA
jgi:hypothetical protein